MSPERWKQIEALCNAARERKPAERSAFLDRACAGDAELHRAVESLLAQETTRTNAVTGDATLAIETTLTPGMKLGPYRIEGRLGAGGMGEVFRAVDTRLGRSVAIKTSRQQFSERFEREARTISSLNHPNICTLYDVGPNYLVMELCEGETLANRIQRVPCLPARP